MRAHRARTLLPFALVVAASFVAVDRPSAQSTCSCHAMRWGDPLGTLAAQPLSPDVAGSSAEALFARVLGHLDDVLRRFRPETWGHGRIAVRVLPGHASNRPWLSLDVDVTPGPSRLVSTIVVPVHACTAHCRPGSVGRRIVFDLRRADGALRGMIDGLAFDLCLAPHARPGWAQLRTTVQLARGPRFPSGGFGIRARHIEAFFSAQALPMLDAFRSAYRRERNEGIAAR